MIKFKRLYQSLFVLSVFVISLTGCSEDGTTNPSDNNINKKYAANLEFKRATIMTTSDTLNYSYGFEVKLYLDTLGGCYYQEALVTGEYITFDGKWKFENNSIIVTDDSNRTYNMKIKTYEEDVYKLPEYTLEYSVNRKWDGEQAKINYLLEEQLWSNFDKKLAGKWSLKNMNKKYPDGSDQEIDLKGLSYYSYTLNIGETGGFREDSIVTGLTVVFTGDCDVWKGRMVLHNDNDIKIGPYSVTDSTLNYKNKVVEDGKDVIISYTFIKK